jgi:hypothetical protein
MSENPDMGTLMRDYERVSFYPKCENPSMQRASNCGAAHQK